MPKITRHFLTGTPWRNGSASDSRSEGCVFESRRGHINFPFLLFVTITSFLLIQNWTEIFTDFSAYSSIFLTNFKKKSIKKKKKQAYT